MFGSLFSAVDNALSIASDILDGEDISREKVSRLISDGISIAAIAAAAGVAVEVIEKLVEKD
jgi:hypothetical protein